MQDIRNVFISHIHDDDEGVVRIKEIVKRHGMTVRNGSITADKFNNATNEDYIKYQILAPRVNWASVLAVYVSPETKNSWWVDWEIEYAYKQGKRIVGVWGWGEKGCDLPETLDRYADAVVGWNGESIVSAIDGTFNGRSRIHSAKRSSFEAFLKEWGPAIAVGVAAVGIGIYFGHNSKSTQPQSQAVAFRRHTGSRRPRYGFLP